MNKEQLEKIVLSAISKVTHIPQKELPHQESFDSYGLESVMMLNIIRELEVDLGELPKTLFFEYDNIKELMGFLSENHLKMEKEISISIVDDKLHPSEQEQSGPDTDAVVDFTIDFESIAEETEKDISERELDVAIIGMSGKFPMADDLEVFWENLIQGKDCIEEIPETLWNWRDYFSEKRGEKGKTYSKWGGFIHDADKFDPLFFGISNLEAEMLDPQERIFLETVYHTLENAGYTKQSLEGQNVGVYVGVMWGQYQLYGEKYANAQSSYASIANRVSYYFDFNGPSIALDTMCSSSLTSLHLACESIKNGECDVAIAGGVNLTTHPNKYIYLSKTGFAASDGRCRSFGDGGDGYVPGDGVGSFLVKPLRNALRDKDNIWGIIKSTTINHGGKAKGFTVPNPKAQTELIKRGIQRAEIQATDLDYLELHGTGTALGDPIEVRALANALELEVGNTIPIGSVKSNIGHLESAAGFAGIAKVLLQMKHKKLVPSIHCEPQNPNLNFEETPFYVQKELEEWETVGGKAKISAVSSFGAGGSNGFVIMKEAILPTQSKAVSLRPYVFLFSARVENQLCEKMKDFERYLDLEYGIGSFSVKVKNKIDEYFEQIYSSIDLNITLVQETDCLDTVGINYELISRINPAPIVTNDLFRLCTTIRDLRILVEKLYIQEYLTCYEEETLSNISYTLQVGREDMKYRVAIIANSIIELYMKVTGISANIESEMHVVKKQAFISNNSQIEQRIIKSLVDKDCQTKLAEFWLSGVQIPWWELYRDKSVKKISLPEYPFAKERCWVEQNNEPEINSNNNKRNYKFQQLLRDLKQYDEGGRLKIQNIVMMEEYVCNHVNAEYQKELRRLTIKNGETDEIILKGDYTDKEELIFNEIDIIRYYNLKGSESPYWTYLNSLEAIQEIKADDTQILCIAKKYFSAEDIERISQFDLRFNQLSIQSEGIKEKPKYVLIDKKSNEMILNVVSEEKKVIYRIIMSMENPDLSSCVYQPVWDEYAHVAIPFKGKVTFVYNHEEAGIIQDAICNMGSRSDIQLVELPEKDRANIDWEKYLNYNNQKVYYFALQKQQEISDFELSEINQNIIVPFWSLLKYLGLSSDQMQLTLITNNVSKVNKQDNINPVSALLKGIARSSEKEFASVTIRIADIDLYHGQLTQELMEILLTEAEKEFAIRGGKVYLQNFMPIIELNSTLSYFSIPRNLVMVGGAGSVGGKISSYLINKYDVNILWIGRRTLDHQINIKLNQISEGGKITYISADVNNREDFQQVIVDYQKKHKIDAIINLAMDFSIKRLAKIENTQYFLDSLSAKVIGNINIAIVAEKLNINKVVYFSSGEAFTGNVGWGVYSSACIFTDALKDYINDNLTCDCVSINWGFWETEDPNVNQQFVNKGINPFDRIKGGYAFDQIISSRYNQLVALDVSEIVKKKMGIIKEQASLQSMKEVADAINVHPIAEIQTSNQIADTLKVIMSAVLKIDVDKMSTDEDLANYGVDSLLITELHSAITKKYGDIPASVILESPTIDDIAAYIYKNHEELEVELLNEVARTKIEEYLLNYGDNFRNKTLKANSSMCKYQDLEKVDSSLKHILMKVDGSDLEIMMCGSGKPLLFLPAIALTAPIWINQIIELSQNYQVFVIHVPGYGLSNIVTGAKTKEVGELIIKALNKLQISEKINLVASCFGSIVATYLAAHHSQLFSSLILVGGFYDGTDLPPLSSQEMSIEQLNQMTSEISNSIGKDFDNLLASPELDKESILKAKEILLNCQCANSLVAIRYLNEMVQLNTTEWLKKIRFRVACWYGDMDTIINPGRSIYMDSILKNSALYKFSSSGHYPFLTHAEKFNELLIKFVEDK